MATKTGDPGVPAGYDPAQFPAFAVTVDVVILTMSEGMLHVLLVCRGEAPFEGMWAIPGGFKRPTETLDAAAKRELVEQWIQRIFTQPVIRAEVLRQPKGTDALAGRITGLALVMDRSNGSVYLDNVSVRSKTATKTWTYAGDNGNGVPGAPPPAFTAEQYALMAAPIPEDSQFDEDVLMPSLTPDEQAAIAVEDWG